MSQPFLLNPKVSVSVQRLGEEREPVLQADDVLVYPGALVDVADEAVFRPAAELNTFYPGLLAPAPVPYVQAVVRAIDPLIRQAFGLGRVAPGRVDCNFSLVTLAPEDLSTAQRLPHIDTADPLRFAILHYLCDERFGGTGFYRHRATGFETLSAARLDTYKVSLSREVAAAPPPHAYIRGETPLFAQTGRVAARFDRLAVYRSCLLHSGQIDAPELLSDRPREGRLTANIFLQYNRL